MIRKSGRQRALVGSDPDGIERLRGQRDREPHTPELASWRFGGRGRGRGGHLRNVKPVRAASSSRSANSASPAGPAWAPAPALAPPGAAGQRRVQDGAPAGRRAAAARVLPKPRGADEWPRSGGRSRKPARPPGGYLHGEDEDPVPFLDRLAVGSAGMVDEARRIAPDRGVDGVAGVQREEHRARVLGCGASVPCLERPRRRGALRRTR